MWLGLKPDLSVCSCQWPEMALHFLSSLKIIRVLQAAGRPTSTVVVDFPAQTLFQFYATLREHAEHDASPR